MSEPNTISSPGGIVERPPGEPHNAFDFEAGARQTAVRELREETGITLNESVERSMQVLPVGDGTYWGPESHRNFVVHFEFFPAVHGPEKASRHEIVWAGLEGLGRSAGDGYHAWVEVRELLSREDLMPGCRVPLESLLACAGEAAGKVEEERRRAGACEERSTSLVAIKRAARQDERRQPALRRDQSLGIKDHGRGASPATSSTGVPSVSAEGEREREQERASEGSRCSRSCRDELRLGDRVVCIERQIPAPRLAKSMPPLQPLAVSAGIPAAIIPDAGAKSTRAWTAEERPAESALSMARRSLQQVRKRQRHEAVSSFVSHDPT